MEATCKPFEMLEKITQTLNRIVTESELAQGRKSIAP